MGGTKCYWPTEEAPNESPYRSMIQDEIKIPRKDRLWPTLLAIWILGTGFGATITYQYAVPRTIVTQVVQPPLPVCVDSVFVMKHYHAIKCDNANHVLHYKSGDEAAVCLCNRKD